MTINKIKCVNCENNPSKKFKLETTTRFKFFHYFKLSRQQKDNIHSSYACPEHEIEQYANVKRFINSLPLNISKHIICSPKSSDTISRYQNFYTE